MGGIIDLGNCLDLTTIIGIDYVKSAHKLLVKLFEKNGAPLPVNKNNNMMRYLDCAVIDYLHDLREKSDLPPIDTVKGVFHEGAPLYENSGFFEKTHIQICVRNPDMIKGVFRVSPEQFD